MWGEIDLPTFPFSGFPLIKLKRRGKRKEEKNVALRSVSVLYGVS
jgi:hypothetical protein